MQKPSPSEEVKDIILSNSHEKNKASAIILQNLMEENGLPKGPLTAATATEYNKLLQIAEHVQEKV